MLSWITALSWQSYFCLQKVFLFSHVTVSNGRMWRLGEGIKYIVLVTLFIYHQWLEHICSLDAVCISTGLKSLKHKREALFMRWGEEKRNIVRIFGIVYYLWWTTLGILVFGLGEFVHPVNSPWVQLHLEYIEEIWFNIRNFCVTGISCTGANHSSELLCLTPL